MCGPPRDSTLAIGVVCLEEALQLQETSKRDPVDHLANQRAQRRVIAVVHRQKSGGLKLANGIRRVILRCHSWMYVGQKRQRAREEKDAMHEAGECAEPPCVNANARE